MKRNIINFLGTQIPRISAIALVVVIGFSFTACGGGGDGGDLPGTITISPSTGVVVGTELTATYSGTESVSYQWKKGSTNVGTNSNKFTPTEAGSYTVTVSAEGYKSKTSAEVTVTGSTLLDLSGTITISPSTDVFIETELTATYTGSESVSFQWKKDGSNVGTASTSNPNEYTPTEGGSYTVTVSAAGYISKTSAAVTVAGGPLLDLSGDITISSSSITTGASLYAYYNGSEYVSFQWKKDGNKVGSPSTSTPNVYTTTEEGSYTVTVSRSGYNSKTSAAINIIARKTWTDVDVGTIFDYEYNGSTYQVDIKAIAYGNGKFVAGGEQGKMATSTDGEIWTAVTDSIFETNDISAIAFIGDKFFAGYGNGKMATSTDGTTWTVVSSFTFTAVDTIFDITYGNGKFVAACGRGKIAYSSDGSTWAIKQLDNYYQPNICAVAYGNNKFVTIDSRNKVRTSADGENWNLLDPDPIIVTSTYSSSYKIVYANNMFVIGGSNGRMAISTDGETWTRVYAFSGNITAIAWGNDKFFFGDQYGNMASSTDFITWADSNSTFGDSNICGIAYGNGKFVAVGEYGKVAYLLDN